MQDQRIFQGKRSIQLMMVIMMMSTITNIIICLDLLAIGIGLPESDTVLLCHVLALRQHLHVGDHLPSQILKR